MIQITTAIERDIQQAQIIRLTGNGSTYHLALFDLSALLSKDVLVPGGGRSQRLGIVVIDQLHIDVVIAPEHGQPWLPGRSADLLANTVFDLLSPDCFRIHDFLFFKP